MLRLVEMNSSDFERYLSFAIKNYADEHVKVGNWSEKEAIAKAKGEYEKLLPEKEKTTNSKLFTLWDDNQEIGMIWLGKRSVEKGYIYDINIWEEYQGNGYGKQAMNEIENIAKNWGLKSIELLVFGNNKVARSLYEKLGYIETNVIMNKKL